MWLPLIILFALLASCAPAEPTSASAKPDAPLQKLELTYDKPVMVGSKIHVVAADLPAGKTVDLAWGTVNGGWLIEDYYYFRGKKFSETTSSLGKFTVDVNGRLDT